MELELTQDEAQGISDVMAYDEFSFRPDYSGRGMMGQRCIGVTHESGDAYRAVECLARCLEDEGHDEAAEHVRTTPASTDSMGLSMISYWTGLNPTEMIFIED